MLQSGNARKTTLSLSLEKAEMRLLKTWQGIITPREIPIENKMTPSSASSTNFANVYKKNGIKVNAIYKCVVLTINSYWADWAFGEYLGKVLLFWVKHLWLTERLLISIWKDRYVSICSKHLGKNTIIYLIPLHFSVVLVPCSIPTPESTQTRAASALGSPVRRRDLQAFRSAL